MSLRYSCHPTAHFATLRSCFTSSHSVLLLLLCTSRCPPSCLLASFLPLHLYYPLNNSLCIGSCVCSFCSQFPEGVSLEAIASRTFFMWAPHPSLCFLSFLCFQEILLPWLLWNSVGLQSSWIWAGAKRHVLCVSVAYVYIWLFAYICVLDMLLMGVKPTAKTVQFPSSLGPLWITLKLHLSVYSFLFHWCSGLWTIQCISGYH